VSAVTAPGSVTVGWIGDSRAYWLTSSAPPAASNGAASQNAPENPSRNGTAPEAEPDAASPLDTLDLAKADRPELHASRALTSDDSWAAYMIAEGALTEAEAEAHPNAHVITGWLGADNDDLRPHVATFRPDPDVPGTLLVCSDGLWNYLPGPEDLAAVLAEAAADPAADPLGAARALVRRALDAGGRDNITVAVIPLPSRTTPSPSSPMEHAR
jgi:serine/threonine protein phosphatase PrpC